MLVCDTPTPGRFGLTKKTQAMKKKSIYIYTFSAAAAAAAAISPTKTGSSFTHPRGNHL